jgi:hypothetical protein
MLCCLGCYSQAMLQVVVVEGIVCLICPPGGRLPDVYVLVAVSIIAQGASVVNAARLLLHIPAC